MAYTCECEHAKHFEGSGAHKYGAKVPTAYVVKTPYGVFSMCATCKAECHPQHYGNPGLGDMESAARDFILHLTENLDEAMSLTGVFDLSPAGRRRFIRYAVEEFEDTLLQVVERVEKGE